MNLQSKYAIVSGASTGIGQAIALEFAKEGAFIALVSRNKEKLLKTKDLIAENNGKAEIFTCDLTKVDSINSFISSIKQKTKIIDILVNVAGIWHGENEAYAGKDFDKYPQQVILDTFSVGTIAPILLLHAFIPLIPKKGKIINISGTFSSGAKGWLPYYVSKRAIEDLTVGLAQELKEKDIQVNCISLSDTATEAYKKYFPQYIKDAQDPREIADFAFKLGLDDKISGEVFVIKKDKKPYKGFHL